LFSCHLRAQSNCNARQESPACEDSEDKTTAQHVPAFREVQPNVLSAIRHFQYSYLEWPVLSDSSGKQDVMYIKDLPCPLFGRQSVLDGPGEWRYD
jgi:hypothetical protein